ncbi:insulin-like receptor isoform X2 [Toxorhynchites rutilus septentrionalis]|uniref:insulin-like receptor isoform X2 n=1 Tax=Toxorhynchites rutilus septentrionalis TaxID=329112 RepID=UPI00247980AC|nr:insulin-like receptor isoform X2 [Toxorhynchites rutilus septentrionalis]
MEVARSQKGRRSSRSSSEMSSGAEESPRLVEEAKSSEGRTKQCRGGEMVELVQRQPEVVVVFPKKLWPSAGLANLLVQLATKLKQRHRTAVIGSAAHHKKKRKTDHSVFGEMCHQQLESGTTAASSSLRPRRLAWLLMASVLLFSVLIAPVSMVQGNEIRPSQGRRDYKKGEVCGSVDVRNNPTNLERLNGCVVVEGFVHILLIDKYTEVSFENYTFPLLTEITEYLLLFRVNGLKTLRKLFPNLAVIRGGSLVGDYAFIIYELMHIEEIGLKSLTNVVRGGVRIEKNPKLCFANTIDWNAIAPGSENYIRENQNENSCPICPTKTNVILPNGTTQAQKCPEVSNTKETLCWNAQHCQKKCPSRCGDKTCNELGECCSDQCLGGCSGPHGSNCTVCRDYSIDPEGNRQCVDKCPEGMYIHHSRCVTADQCYALKKPISLDSNPDLPAKPYIPHNESCVMECPVDHELEVVNERRRCRKCEKCPKRCSGGNIDNIQRAQTYRGCEIIEGSLEIQLRSGSGSGENIVKELEKFLSSITEIKGYLKIVRSYPLLSLGFMKKLRIIHGTRAKISNSSLYIVENQNLQELFDHNVTIADGKLFFYNNPMLCVNKIKDLRKVNPKIEIDNEAQLAANNGDRAACEITELQTAIKSISSETAIIQWAPFTQLADSRQLLGYVLYYIDAPFQNVTFFDGRDACNTEGWKLDDISEFKPENWSSKILTQLKPYTQYAFYVKTYTLASEGLGGQSKINYFRTAPGTPSVVKKVNAFVTDNKLTLVWQPPRHMNGELRDYEIFVELNADGKEQLKQRNYCDEEKERKSRGPALDELPTLSPPVNPLYTADVCTEDECRKFCPASSSKFDRSNAELKIGFEDQLHNHVYIKNPSSRDKPNRRKRSVIAIPSNTTLLFPNITDNFNTDSKDRRTALNSTEKYYQSLYNTTNQSSISYPLSYFKHYGLYVFKIRVCRKPAIYPGNNVKLFDTDTPCSTDVIFSFRTPKREGADEIPMESILVEEQSNHTQRVIKVQWREPVKPNGPVVSFIVRYQRIDVASMEPGSQCVTYQEFSQSGFTFLPKLEPGNYSIRVMATTIAGQGPFSAPRYVFLKKDDGSTTLLWSFIVALLLVFVSGAGAIYWYKCRYLRMQNMRLIAHVNPDYAGVVYKIDEWEVDRDHIIQLEELGQGSFGMVYRGISTQLRGTIGNIPCAIKTVNENATIKERDSFLIEASVMKQFDTHHVVRLLGVVSQNGPTLVVMELMANGDLKGYLRRHRPDYENGNEPSPQPPTLRQIYQMAIEIADGMAYLSAKKFVHRDLAARNCMVAEDLTVKIGDFGMTRDIYETDYYRKGTKGFLPVRWMSPESLKDGVFDSCSDVFSYGVVLWEMATLASQPYQGLTNDQVLRYVIDGGVMERPENCPDKLYELMRRCWQHRPSARPSFIDIINLLLPDANEQFHRVSFFSTIDAQEMAAPTHHQIIMDDVTTPLHPGGRDEEDDDDMDRDEEMNIGDVDDQYSIEMTNSHLVPNNGPMATIRSPHSPLR